MLRRWVTSRQKSRAGPLIEFAYEASRFHSHVDPSGASRITATSSAGIGLRLIA